MIVDLSLAPRDSLESNVLSLKSFLTQIRNIKSEEDIIFDLSKIKWSTPLFITPLSCVISNLTAEGTRNIEIRSPNDPSCRSYLEAIGFPKITESLVSTVITERSYIPIVNINNSAGDRWIKDRGKILTELNNVLLNKLNLSSILEQVALYTLTELSDNINQHSSAEKGWFFAQFYKNKNYFDICIVDNGLTIGGNFRDHDIQLNDFEAILQALGGKSTKSVERGFGLSTTTTLLTNASMLGSEMVVISGNAGVLIKPIDKYQVDCSNWGFKGTIINLRLPKRSKMTSEKFYETVR